MGMSASAAFSAAVDEKLGAVRVIGGAASPLAPTVSVTVTRDSNGRISSVVYSDGTNSKTVTITRDSNGRISSMS